jgi:hypothetical protein
MGVSGINLNILIRLSKQVGVCPYNRLQMYQIQVGKLKWPPVQSFSVEYSMAA